MTPTPSDAVLASEQTIRARVLRAIAANRTAGLHFPGHFLAIEWEAASAGTAEGLVADGPHFRNREGAMGMAVLGIFADNLLAAAVRTGTPPGVRLGTIYLHLQFTGAPATGDINGTSRLLCLREGATLQQSLTSGTLYAQGRPICHLGGEFVLLDPPSGVVLGPLPWERTGPPPVVPVDIGRLDPHEDGILDACDAALAKASPRASFIEHFWGGAPRRTARGASNRVVIGPHIGNRVGHVQGGIMLGLAARTADAAAPAAMMMSNLSAWYVSPGRGDHLQIRSSVLHAGRTTAVVRTEIKTGDGERVLEAVSHHVARKREGG